ncbi:MAG: SdrD B-like domain-containing protein, partial [Anaerolineales bacterium]
MVTILAPVSPAYAAVPAGYSEYFIPGGEDQLWAIYEDLDNDPDLVEADGMHAVIAVTAAADDTTVYYDHWEDGYDAVPATPGPSTEVYVLNIGDVQEFESSNIPIPRGSTLNACNNDGIAPATDPCYDGRDRIYIAGGAVTVTRASWAESIGTVFALAWEIYPTEPFLTDYTIPVGQDLAGSPTLYDDFDRAYVIVQATTSGTSVTIDNPSTAGVDVSTTLNEGETTELYSIDAGTTVSASQPVQVQFIVGQFAAGQASEARGYSAVPDSLWDTEYYSPVGGFSAGNTDLFLYNPNSYTITINYEDSAGTGSFTVPADSTLSYSDGRGSTVPINSAVYISSSDVFWGIGSGDTESYNYDWGYSLVPAYALTDEYFLGWAPGDYNPTPANNGSPVFVTPVQNNTTVFVDFSPTDEVVDVTYTLDRLDSQKIFDADNNNTGMHIWATGPIAVAWGEDPDTAAIGNPYMDLGYTTLPLPEAWIDVVLTIDKTADPNVLADAAGEVSTFTVVVESADYPVDDVDVIDTLPDGWLYVAGSTQIDGSPAADPIIAGQVLTWDLNIDLGISDSFTLSFDAETDDPPPSPASGYSENVAQAVGTRLGGAQVFSPSDNAFVFFTSLTIDKDTSTPSVSIGGTAAYTIVLENIGAAAVTNATVADTLPAGFTYAGGSVVEVSATRTSTTNPAVGDSALNWGTWDIDPGGTVTITFDVDVPITTPAGTYDNTATADSTEVGPIDDDGTVAQDAHTPSGADPEDDEDVTVLAPVLTIDKDTSTPYAEAGGTAAYTILVENSGGADATDVTISDTLPAGFTFASQSISATSATRTSTTDPGVGDNALNWGTWTIQPGGSVEISFAVDVGGGVGEGTYDNTAAADSTETGAIDDDGTAAQDDDTPAGQDPEDDEDVTVTLLPDLSVDKTSSAAGNPVSPGDTISYTIVITNNGAGRATDVVVSDPLPAGTTYVAESTVATGPLVVTDTFRDEFNAQAYNNNDGTASWATNWVEFGDDGSPIGQDEQIINDVSNYQLRLGDNDGGGEGVQREADLTGYDSATISLIYRRGGLEDPSEYVEVQISDDGGATWTPIGQFAGPGTDAAYQTFSYDISGDISATMNTTVRLITSATMDQGFADNDYVYFDNIEIAASYLQTDTLDNVPAGANPDLADGVPPDLVEAGDGFALDPGDTLTVTYDVAVDDPLAPGITEISNTASVTSAEIPTPVEDTVTDPVAASIGDFVWNDLDGDGVQDGGEPGIDGVTIDLIEDTNGNGAIDLGEPVLSTQTTAGGGAYDFSGLAAGDYIVDVTDTGGVLTGYVLTGGTDPDAVT